MAVDSNINMYYEELVASLAERAKNSSMERGDAITQAIDDGLIYYADQAYIVAHALEQGLVEWGGNVAWDEIYDMLYNDINEEMGEE